MIKIFTTNQNGKIEFTEQELLDFVEEIKLECRKEEHQIAPANPTILPTQSIWTTTPYLAVKPEGSANNVRTREGKGGIFDELLKELGY